MDWLGNIKMKALRLYGAMDLKVDEIDETLCGPGQVRVKTKYCGLCGSDRPRLLSGEVPFFPNTLGHEFSATVVETGEGVNSVKPGDLAAVVPLLVCHTCDRCRTGHYGQCRNKKFIGLRVENMGGFAEYNTLPAVNVLKVPEGTTKIEAAFIEPVSVALHSIFRSGLKPGDDAAIIGSGTIGQLLIQGLRIMGAHHIHVFDIDDKQLKAAYDLGADYCYNTTKDEFFDEYARQTGSRYCPVVFEAVGIETAVMLALKICAVNSNIALVGYLDKPIAFNAAQMRLLLENELNIFGVWQSYDLDFPGNAFRLGLSYLAEKKLKVDQMIYKTVDVSGLSGVLKEWKEPGKVNGKIMVDFSTIGNHCQKIF
jgi:L-iditol 2-dehydrogenase